MPGTALVAPAGADLVLDHQRDDLDDAVDAFAASAKSAATRRAYRSDARDFIAWCVGQGVAPVPAEPRTVCRYVTALVGRGLSVSTVDRRVAAITALHRAKGQDTPTAREEVRTVLAGIRRTLGRAPRKKAALTVDLVAKVLRRIGPDLTGIRDRAMIALCFGAALRRSELVGLDRDDVEQHPRGLLLTLRRSKTDQQGRGHKVAVVDGKLKVPQAVQAWIDAAGIGSGPLFRGCDRGKILDTPLDGGSFARMLKRRVEAVGLDPKLFSGHSCRRGFATSADEAGADLQSIAGQLRHAKLDTTRGYTETGDMFRRNAGKGFV
jgi:site-specific recombinase XerD